MAAGSARALPRSVGGGDRMALPGSVGAGSARPCLVRSPWRRTGRGTSRPRAAGRRRVNRARPRHPARRVRVRRPRCGPPSVTRAAAGRSPWCARRSIPRGGRVGFTPAFPAVGCARRSDVHAASLRYVGEQGFRVNVSANKIVGADAGLRRRICSGTDCGSLHHLLCAVNRSRREPSWPVEPARRVCPAFRPAVSKSGIRPFADRFIDVAGRICLSGVSRPLSGPPDCRIGLAARAGLPWQDPSYGPSAGPGRSWPGRRSSAMPCRRWGTPGYWRSPCSPRRSR